MVKNGPILNREWAIGKRAISYSLLAILSSLCLYSCAYSNPSKEEKKVDIRGKIAKITQASEEAKRHGRLCTIMVEGVKPDGKDDKALVTVTRETLIFRQTKQTAGFEDLKEGLQVEVKFKGPVSLSYPPMATAGEILILEQASEKR